MKLIGKKTRERMANLAKLERPDSCENCGKFGTVDAHHKVKRSQGGDESRENIKFLCRSCHVGVHG